MKRLATIVLACLAFPGIALAADPVTVREVPVAIPATQPDDQGAPVALDGGVDIPSSGCPCPGVIINHGFLGNWKDSGNVARELATHGYVVLRYSSRGFGKTPGEVDLMGPKESQDLLDAVHWLNDRHSPVVGGLVRHNRIGQFGGSYGGAHAWSLARSGDAAVRTVIPTATWTDAYDALLPNNVELLAYVNGFYATGLEPVAKAQNSELSTDDNYSQNMHRWVAEANSGAGLDDLRQGAAERSVAGQYDKVRIPVFIVQGLNDGLFSANQAIDAYQALHARHVPTRLYLGGIGHPPSDSSLDSPEAKHVEAQVLAWLDRWLKGDRNGIDRQPPIEYSRADYFHNKWDGTTRSAKSYPFGKARRMSFCTTGPGGGTLSATPCASAPPAVAANHYGGSGWDEEPVTASGAGDVKSGFADAFGAAFPETRFSPPTLSYDSAPLGPGGLDLAGVPSLKLQVAATAAFQIDPKLYDFDPKTGAAKLLTRGAFGEPVEAAAAGPVHEVDFDAFGLSNLIPAGHALRVTLSTSDAPYLRPNTNPFAVAVMAGSTIDLPTAAG
jgi:ABC-2 type transport system ATP-binding protein